MRILLLSRLSVICLTLSLFSCKKDKKNEVTVSTCSYEVDGIPYSYTSKTEITFSFLGWIQTSGKEKPTPHLQINTPKLSLRVDNYKIPILPGVYAGKTYDSYGWIKGVSLAYTHDNDSVYQSAFNNPITEVIINRISRDGVSGTFSGKVERVTLAGLDTLKITNGVFTIYTYKQ